ncbi:molybdenum ABC transporter ATP-binding protein [Chitinimonas sp. JJ19]|uniref:molybdenum ABC transporter ATP-binding protein n=1 Tax=Chitinimonas sp. JJ19 TaxID=3109352 RepID=UPI001A47455C|nr:molybdenum ABC transporter ATP-binding protein [Chitinimonas sp.]
MSIRAKLSCGLGAFRLAAELSLPGSGVTALFGASGSGKTSLLRCLAGLEPTARGYLEVSGEVWLDSERGVALSTHLRGVGLVFQEASLFAHLNVRRNLEFGLQRTPMAQRRLHWDGALELLGIGHLLERLPTRLSGGERQRVAIARALLASPRMLLLDEPLAALDQPRKDEILPYLDRLHRELAIPMVYVTHAMEEVSRLADHLVLLEAGKVVAAGPLSSTLARPDLPASFEDEIGVIVQAVVTHVDSQYQLAQLSCAGGALRVPQQGLKPADGCRVRIRARDVSLTLHEETDTSILNRLPGVVEAIHPSSHPAQVLVSLMVGELSLAARITRLSCDNLQLQVGSKVWAQIKSAALL